MVLGKSLHDERGHVLLAEGITLNERLITSLHARGYASVYIRDGKADDVVPPDLVSERVRAATTAHLHALFTIVHPGGTQGGPRQAKGMPGGNRRMVEDLYHDVDAIMGEIFTAGAFAGMASLKSHDNYTFEHSVETAVVGIMLGKRLGMQRADLRQLGLGCLLHDVGKTLTRLDVLNKPGSLTPEETRHMQQHPRAGYEMIAELGLESTVPQHIAWQHHERQDGTGYPRGLKGTNRVARTMSDLTTPGRIMLLSELASVADVYSALSSDRPYRGALAPDQVASIMESLTGSYLNREVMQAFFRVVPTYPIGLHVRISGGQFDGWNGVVVAVEPPHLHRPIVRLLGDARGQAIEPDEIDLRRLPDLALTAKPLASEAVA